MSEIGLDDVADFARGAAFLGSGGGGDPYIGRLMLEEVIRKTGPVKLTDVASVPDDAWLVTAAMMGAPSVGIEKLPSGLEAKISLEAVERVLGDKIFGIIAPEIGGLNALLPVILAAQLGRPIVDADGMGRAFPELQMITFNIFGQLAAPLAICDESGNCVTIETNDNVVAERLARQTVVAMGSSAQICSYPMRGGEAKKSAIRGTLSVALEIGRVIRRARKDSISPIAALLRYLPSTTYFRNGRHLFDGKVIELSRQVRGGFTVGIATLEAAAGDKLTIEFRNEHLLAKRNGRIVAMVPDLIVALDQETSEPVTVEAIKYGHRLSIVGLSAPPSLRTPDALKVVGPRCFGLDEDFQPLETIAV